MNKITKVFVIAGSCLLLCSPAVAEGATPAAVSKTVELVEISSFMPLWVVVGAAVICIALMAYSLILENHKALWANALAFLCGLFAFGGSFVCGEGPFTFIRNSGAVAEIRDYQNAIADYDLMGYTYTMTTQNGTTTADTVMQMLVYENTGLLIFTAAVSIFSLVMLAYSAIMMAHSSAEQLDTETGL